MSRLFHLVRSDSGQHKYTTIRQKKPYLDALRQKNMQMSGQATALIGTELRKDTRNPAKAQGKVDKKQDVMYTERIRFAYRAKTRIR